MKTLNHFIKFYEINFSVSSSLCMALETFLDKQNCRWFVLILSNGGWPLWHLNFEWHGRPCFLQLSRAWKCFVNLSSRASTFTHWLRKNCVHGWNLQSAREVYVLFLNSLTWHDTPWKLFGSIICLYSSIKCGGKKFLFIQTVLGCMSRLLIMGWQSDSQWHSFCFRCSQRERLSYGSSS